jgi:hypothetical protein
MGQIENAGFGIDQRAGCGGTRPFVVRVGGGAIGNRQCA